MFHPCPFIEKGLKEVLETVEINLTPYAMLTRLVVSEMRKRGTRSGVVSISSGSGKPGFPLIPVYSATKGFGDVFSRSMAVEEEQIDFMSVLPFAVETKLIHLRGIPFFIDPT